MRLLLVAFFSLIYCNLHAQYISWGNDKGSTKWEQIQTEHFQIIYPEDYDSVAQLFCKRLNYVYESASNSLGHHPKKVSVLLHNQSTISNAFVAWAPTRMEIFDAPAQSEPALEWFELLAIHEYRHVVQTDMINTGLTKIFYYLMGEQATGAVLGIHIPLWFMEGDAVCTETALTKSGRGRTASFSMGYRAQMHSKGIYSYDKAYFGSYKDYVPNHYKMGYYFVSGVRREYTPRAWETTLQRVGEKPLSFMPFNKGLKIATSKGKLELYDDIFEKQNAIWEQSYKAEGHSPFDTLSKTNNKEYTNYSFPQKNSQGLVIAEKSGHEDISYIVSIDKNGFTKKLVHTGFKNPYEPFSINDMSVVWSENNSNIRWELAATQDIYIYTLSSEKISKINTDKRIFSPVINKLGDKIAAVSVNKNGTYSIVVYNVGTKKLSKEILLPNNEFPQTPKWDKTGKKLVMITLSTQGKRIIEININDNSIIEIHPYTRDDIANPCSWKDYIFYSSSYSGVDNIYAINKKTKEVARLTSSAFGAKYPSVHNNKLLFSDYSAKGFVVGEKDIFPRSWYSLDVIKKEKYEIASSIAGQEKSIVDFSQMPDTLFASKSYKKINHLFNIHSWMPFYYDTESLEFSSINRGLQFLSQNKLSTMESSFGYRETQTRARKEGFANITYTGFFPIITADYAQGIYNYSDSIFNNKIDVDLATREFAVGLIIPLDFSSRSYYRTINISSTASSFNYNKISEINVTTDSITSYFSASNYNGVMLHYISLTNQRKSVQKDLGPKYAQQLRLGFLQNSPLKAYNSFSNSLYGECILYFPGILNHHSFQLYGGYQLNTNSSLSTFSNMIRLPYTMVDNYSSTKQIYSTEFSYSLPIVYPDISIGPVAYIKRIRAKLFMQYAAILYTDKFVLPGDTSFKVENIEHSNYGVDINFDSHIFRLLPEFNLGLRYAKNINTEAVSWEFLFNYGF